MIKLSRHHIGIGIALTGTVLIMIGAVAMIGHTTSAPQTASTAIKPMDQSPAADKIPRESYIGTTELVDNTFTVKVPNGWHATIADEGNFKAVMFARPEKLTTLQYSAEATPVVDRDGIPSWSGLTEHFFIHTPSPGSEFSPADHQEISSSTFTFDDGTLGTKYDVVKHAEEAVRYGGLLRDNEWQGRTYIYEKDGVRIEAHLALYPSSTIDKKFYETVVRSIKLK